jgi:competence protein ComEA
MKHNLGGNTQALKSLLVVAGLVLFSACARLPRHSAGTDQQATLPAADSQPSAAAKQINLNTAPATELEKLPGVGKTLATRIVEHRNNFGPFRRTEHLIVVRGISDQKFRAMQPFLTIEQ